MTPLLARVFRMITSCAMRDRHRRGPSFGAVVPGNHLPRFGHSYLRAPAGRAVASGDREVSVIMQGGSRMRESCCDVRFCAGVLSNYAFLPPSASHCRKMWLGDTTTSG